MTPIKPFEILSTRQETEGTGVNYRVSKSSFADGQMQTYEIESFVLVPKDEDIDAYLLKYLTESGWIV